MKVVIAAGGLGSRAKPFTDFSPKPMIPIFDRPLIDYIVRSLSRFSEVSEILIVANLQSGRGKQIQNYFEGKEGLLGKKIVFVDDPGEGTGGAILRAGPHLAREPDFLVWFSDNLVDIDVHDMMKVHRRKRALGTIAVSSFRREETGFVEVGEEGKIKRFLEKPVLRSPLPECLGVYAFSRDILESLKKVKDTKRQVNLSLDVLTEVTLGGRLYVYDIGDRPWLDIESPTKVEKNMHLVRQILDSMRLV